MNFKKLISLDNPFRLLYHKIRAIIANFYYGFPSKNMKIIWITGTNWKTTTCNILARWLIANWEKIFMFSTVNIIMWDNEYTNDSKMTSPDAFSLQKLLKEAKNLWIKTAIIETASHGIKMHRIWWVNYDTVILTNITQDHLDLHKTMENYIETKLEIFKKLITYKRKKWIKKTAIINLDSEYHELFKEETFDSLYTYWKDSKSNIRIENIKNSNYWLEFKLNVPWKNLKLKTKLIWNFNVYNISAAVACFISEWIKTEKIIEIVKNVIWIPWRLEGIDNNEWFRIFIDYAHTADALENVITTLNDLKNNWKVIVVFWATWDRDKSKRPLMWEVVSRLADKIILTQDDDYSEDTIEIIKDIIPWIDRKEGENFWVIPDRKEAIRTALIWAKEWDIILLAWKGDENILMTNSWPIEWHDKKIVQEILKAIDDNKIIK
jgi:UDP-N-acetylmuramyl-tripeptide synthetase